jgi:hypothetical protein
MFSFNNVNNQEPASCVDLETPFSEGGGGNSKAEKFIPGSDCRQALFLLQCLRVEDSCHYSSSLSSLS